MASKTSMSSQPERSKSQLRTDKLIERLLDAATQFFMQNGFDSTSMGEIATFAHASKETFYRHFPTKEDLFRAVVLRSTRQMASEFTAALNVDDAPLKALRSFGEIVLERMVTVKANGLHRMLAMERERFPDFAEIFHANGPAQVHAALSTYLDGQIAKGTLRKMNTTIAARQFFNLIGSDIMIGATAEARKEQTKADIKRRVSQALDCFLNGYGR